MENSKAFDYDLPTRDTLAGIFLEVSDGPIEQTEDMPDGPGQPSAAQLVALFGVPVSVDDSINAKQSPTPPDGRISAVRS